MLSQLSTVRHPIQELKKSEATHILSFYKFIDTLSHLDKCLALGKLPQLAAAKENKKKYPTVDELFNRSLFNFSGMAKKFTEKASKILEFSRITIDPTGTTLSNQITEVVNLESDLRTMESNEFTLSFATYLDADLLKLFNSWLFLMHTNDFEIIPENIKNEIQTVFSEETGPNNISYQWPPERGFVFQRAPRYDMLTKAIVDTLQDEINGFVKKGLQISPSVHTILANATLLNKHCKEFARHVNRYQGLLESYNPTVRDSMPFFSGKADDVAKRKERELRINNTQIEEMRSESLFTSNTIIPLTSAVLVLREDIVSVNDSAHISAYEYGTVILSAGAFSSQSSNEWVADIANTLAVGLEIKQIDPQNPRFTLRELIELKTTEPMAFYIQVPLEIIEGCGVTPTLVNQLQTPRSILVLKTNLVPFKLQVPTPEPTNKTKPGRRSSLGGGKQYDGQSNIIQIFNSAEKSAKIENVISLRFPSSRDRDFVSEIISQLCSNTPLPIVGHRRRASMFGKSNTEELSSPTNAMSGQNNNSQFLDSLPQTSVQTTNVPAIISANTNLSSLSSLPITTAPIKSTRSLTLNTKILPPINTGPNSTTARRKSGQNLRKSNSTTSSSLSSTTPTAAVAGTSTTPSSRIRPQGGVATPLAEMMAAGFKPSLPRKRPSQQGHPTAMKRRSKDNFTQNDEKKVSLDQKTPGSSTATATAPTNRPFGALSSNQSNAAGSGVNVGHIATPAAGTGRSFRAPGGADRVTKAPMRAKEQAETVQEEPQAECNQQ